MYVYMGVWCRQLCSSGDLILLTQPAAAAPENGPKEAGGSAEVLALVESVERDEANREQYSVQAFINLAPSSASGGLSNHLCTVSSSKWATSGCTLMLRMC